MEGEEREEGVGALFSLLLDDEPAAGGEEGGEERRGEERRGEGEGERVSKILASLIFLIILAIEDE